jgi:DNA-nicking Smr family endonuclease
MPRLMKQPKDNRVVQDDDRQTFREAVADALPLPPTRKVALSPSRPKPVAHQTLKDEREALNDSLKPWDADAETGEELSYLRPGLSKQDLKKLRRGHWVIQDELDLHGLDREQARVMLAEFLNRCIRRGLRCVRVIHGKGLGSKGREPVLKRNVGVWLAQRKEVLGFCQARPSDGGSGAVVVLLKGAGVNKNFRGVY